MDLVNEFEKEIKELRKQKDSIEKLSEQSANLKVERSTKNEKGIISNNVCQYYYYGDRNSNQFFAT